MLLKEHWEGIHGASDDPDARLARVRAFFGDSDVALCPRVSAAWWELAMVAATDVWSAIRKVAAPHLAPQHPGDAQRLWVQLAFIEVSLPNAEWFKCEGYLLVLREAFRTRESIAALSQASGDPATFELRLAALLHKVVVPLAKHKQLSVRELTARCAPSLLSAFPTSAVKEEHEAAIASVALERLQAAARAPEAAATHDVEGALQLMRQLNGKAASNALFGSSHSDTSCLPFLISHSAATVRHHIAELLGGPHGHSTAWLLKSLREQETRIGCDWPRVETLLIAAHARLTATLSQATITSQWASQREVVIHAVDVLRKLSVWHSATQFEVRRISIQITPLVLQLIIRCGCVSELAALLDELPLGPGGIERSTWATLVTFAAWFAVIRGTLTCDGRDVSAISSLRELPAPAQVLLRTYTLDGGQSGPSAGKVSTCEAAEHQQKMGIATLWFEALASDVETARCAPDFAVLCLDAWLAIPVWADFVVRARSHTHVQCLLLEAIETVMCDSPAPQPLFRFRSHEDFLPPRVEEDGGWVSSGECWLSQRDVDIPVIRKTVDSSTRSVMFERLRAEPIFVDSISRMLSQLLPKTSTEPAVVHRLMDLSTTLSSIGLVLPEEVFRHVIERLTIVSPQWKQGDFNAPAAKPSASNFDDSEDDSDDGAGAEEQGSAVTSISVDSEFLAAQRVVKVLRLRDSAFEARHRTEIDIIMRYGTPTQSPA